MTNLIIYKYPIVFYDGVFIYNYLFSFNNSVVTFSTFALHLPHPDPAFVACWTAPKESAPSFIAFSISPTVTLKQ